MSHDCPRCQRRESILNAYAEQMVAFEMENETLRDAHKVSDEVARAALDQLHTLTKTLERVRRQNERLVKVLRRTRTRRPR